MTRNFRPALPALILVLSAVGLGVPAASAQSKGLAKKKPTASTAKSPSAKLPRPRVLEGFGQIRSGERAGCKESFRHSVQGVAAQCCFTNREESEQPLPQAAGTESSDQRPGERNSSRSGKGRFVCRYARRQVGRRHNHSGAQVPGVARAESDGPLGRINFAETRARLRNRGRCGTYSRRRAPYPV